MTNLLKFAFVVVGLAACPAQVVDRMVAVVNRHVILQSELEEAEHVDLLMQGKPLNEISGQEKEAELDRLIDQALLQQQILNTTVVEPKAEEISAQLRDLRSRLPGATTDEKWQAMLATYEVTERDVEIHMARQLRILKFIDLRFRTLARADRASISNYYYQTLLPQLRQQGAPEPPLSQVNDRIEEILTQQRINDLLNSWLQALRSQAQIEKMNTESTTTAGARR